jgi:hypothetical protein
MPRFLHTPSRPGTSISRLYPIIRALSRRLLPAHILQGGAMRPAQTLHTRTSSTPGLDVPGQSISSPSGPNSVVSTPGVPGPGATRAFPLSRPYPERPGGAPQPAGASQPTGAPQPGGRHHRTAQAIIGDALRIPILWCQFGSCIARYTHRDALGERDLRVRALAAGWRYDALGRLACPRCVQSDPFFWMTRPPVPAYRWLSLARELSARRWVLAAREHCRPPCGLGLGLRCHRRRGGRVLAASRKR